MIMTLAPTKLEVVAGTGVPRIQSVEVPSSALKFNFSDVATTSGRTVRSLSTLEADGLELKVTARTRNSLLSLIGQSASVFNLFTPDEVLARAVETNSLPDEVRIHFARHAADTAHDAFAITTTNAITHDAEQVAEVLAHVDPSLITFQGGELVSLHAPSRGADFKVLVESLTSMAALHLPLDGWGRAHTYLATIRSACTNLNIWVSKAFKADLPERTGIEYLRTAVHAFDIGDLSTKAGERLKTAAQTPASIAEVQRVMNAFNRHWSDSPRAAKVASDAGVMSAFRAMVNGTDMPLTVRYGIGNLWELPQRAQSALKAECTVYDLWNFTNEVTTHVDRSVSLGRNLGALTTSMLSDDSGFDFEGEVVTSAQQARFLAAAALN